VEPADALARGRASIAGRAWSDAYASLSEADGASPLDAADLELLGLSAYMLGRDDEWSAALERAHHQYVRSGDSSSAVRCALWVCVDHMLRGELGPATGWLGRVHRLLEDSPAHCLERGYALIPDIFRHEAMGDWEAAAATAGEAAAIGERFDDPDLVALGRQAQGGILAANGRVAEGLALADEAMVTLKTEEVSPIVAGLVYCGVILACRDAYDVRRAREWTAALTRWCDAQRDLVAFTGRCLVHRAEIMQLGGDWPEALLEATRAAERLAEGFNRGAAAEAFYRQGELHRARGELAAAERSYREASNRGREPQPGLALTRMAQGRSDAAVAAIRRVLTETGEPFRRAGLLAAAVEIYLAAGEAGAAREAADELHEHAVSSGSELLRGAAAHARGAVELARGDPTAALVPLREALATWQAIGAPYEEARSRELIGRVCRALGDGDSATLELEAARAAYSALGAAADLRRVEALQGRDRPADPHGLTGREREVLRLVATGKSNKAIAEELVLSVRTVDRHVSNILAKLQLSSRVAATAFAYEHELV